MAVPSISPVSPVPSPNPPSLGAGGIAAEIGIGALQLVVGTGVQVGAVAAAVNFPVPKVAVPLVLASPTATGVAVWGVGKLSPNYNGSLGWSIAGAYIGALGGPIGGYALGHYLETRQGSSNSNAAFTGLLFGLAGYLVGPAIGATTAWHISKQRKKIGDAPQAAAPAPVAQLQLEDLRLSAFAPTRQTYDLQAPALSATLLSLQF